MTDVDMKDATAAAAAAAAGGANKDAAPVPASIKLEDIVRNAELIVKAVESNTARLTTRAISRCGHPHSAARAHAGRGFGCPTTSLAVPWKPCTERYIKGFGVNQACWSGVKLFTLWSEMFLRSVAVGLIP